MIFETDFVQLEIAIFKSTLNYFVIIPRFDKASNGGIIFLFIRLLLQPEEERFCCKKFVAIV